jgi:O-antigen/teichoic acid export membrane protein
MQKRTRKFIGAVAMLVFVIVYALLAMVLAQARPTQEAPVILQTLIYAVLGLAWILPLMPLIRWMEQGRLWSVKRR